MKPHVTSPLTWETKAFLFIALLVSVFFPFYIGLIIFLISLVLLLVFEDIPEDFITLSGSTRWLWAFVLYSFGVSLLGRNSLGMLISLYFPIALLFFTYYQKNVRPSFLENILSVTLYASLFLSLYSVLENFNIVGEWDYTFISPAMAIEHPGRVEATFFNPNYFATMLAFFVVIGLYKTMREKKPGKRLLFLLITLANVVTVFFTGSRTAPLVIFSSAVIFFVLLGHKKTGIFLVVFLGAVFLGIVFTGNYPRMESLLWALEDRDLIWETAVRGIQDNVLWGQGPLTYLHIYALYGGKATFHAHNLLLNAVLSYGAVGCSLLLYPLFRFGKLLSEMRRHKQLRHQFALYGSLAAVVLIQGLTDLGILWFQTSFLFLMVMLTAPNLLKAARGEETASLDHDAAATSCSKWPNTKEAG